MCTVDTCCSQTTLVMLVVKKAVESEALSYETGLLLVITADLDPSSCLMSLINFTAALAHHGQGLSEYSVCLTTDPYSQENVELDTEYSKMFYSNSPE